MEFNGKGNHRGLVTSEMEGRKRPALFVRKANQISKVATFGSKEDKEVFEMYLTFILTGKGALDDEGHNNTDSN